jgi:hypothetical protein
VTQSEFVAYVGPADIHDGTVRVVEHAGATARVVVEGYSGNVYVFEFRGVVSVLAHQPEGMLLYAISEMTAPTPLRRFVFVNWHDDDKEGAEVALEVVALEMVQITQV